MKGPWWRWRRRRAATRRPFRALVLALIVAAAVAPAGFTSTQYRVLNDTASWLAQREVSVQCLTWPESIADDVIAGHDGAEAYVFGNYDVNGLWRPSSVTVFKYGHCENLLAVARGDLSGRKASDVAFSILVLTHESGHLRGHRWSADEAKTENWAIRHFVPVAVRLGLTEKQARVFLHWAVEWHKNLPAQYLTPGCSEPFVDDQGLLQGCRPAFGG